MTNNMVRTTGLRTVKDDQTWRYGEQLSGTVSVTLDMDVFQAITKSDRDKYFTGYTDDATDFYIKSGLPLVRITSGAPLDCMARITRLRPTGVRKLWPVS